MKKFLILVVILLRAISVYAYSPKVAIVEEATNTSNQISADHHADFYSMLKKYNDRVIPIVYHTDYPNSQDPMYLENPEMSDYATEYCYMFGSNAFCFNGIKEGELYNAQMLIEQDILDLYKQESPYNILITGRKIGNTVHVSVIVSSSVSKNGLKLRTAIVEKHVYYPPGVAGTNGETDFYYVARKMLPDASGKDCSLLADKPQVYEYSFDYKDNWDKKEIFIVAFLQDSKTREIFQAGCTNTGILDFNAETDCIYLTTNIQNELSFNFNLINLGDYSVLVKPQISLDNSIIPSNWTLSVTPDKILELPPGWPKKATVEVNPAGQTGYARIALILEPKSNCIYNDSVFYFYVATDSIINTFVDGVNDMRSHSMFNNVNFSGISAFIPYNEKDLQILNFIDYKTLILNYNMFEGNVPDTIIPDNLYEELITSAMNNNKNFVLCSENMLSIKQYSHDDVRIFFDSILSVSNSGNPVKRYVEDDTGAVKSHLSFNIAGFTDELIFGDYNTRVNDSKAPGIFVLKTDLITCRDNTESTPILYYDGIDDNIAMVRRRLDSSKIIYSTFNFEAIGNIINKIELWTRILSWINKPKDDIGAVITLPPDTLNFGTIRTMDTSSRVFYIGNIGDMPLTITSIKTTGDDSARFEIIDLNYPFTIQPDMKKMITINFIPIEKKYYKTELIIQSNAQNSDEKIMRLKGEGVTGLTIEDYQNQLYMVYPNPASDKLIINSDKQIYNIKIFDILGFEKHCPFANSEGRCIVNIYDLNDGIYFILIQIDDRVLTRKFVVRK
ncbi:MAG: T9SS type A sorting domain-containing protein [bacterium]